MRNLSLVLASAAMLIGASTAMAQTDATAASTQTTTTTTATQQPATGTATTTTTTTTASNVDPNAVVCKRMAPETGTRIGSRQICRTNAQWDAMHTEVEHDVHAYQQTHTSIGTPGH